MRRFFIVVALASGLSVNAAEAQYQTYSSWVLSGDTYRTAYVAGALDAYLAVALPGLLGEPGQLRAQHFRECLGSGRITDGQLASNVANYAASRPDLHREPTILIVIRYLEELCFR